MASIKGPSEKPQHGDQGGESSLPFRSRQSLQEMWLGFMIKHQGHWTSQDERGLLAWAKYNHQVRDDDWRAAQEQAATQWNQSGRHIVLCVGSVCIQDRPRPTSEQLKLLEHIHRCPVFLSDCQNRCSRSPSTVEIDSDAHPRHPAKPLI